MKRYEPRTPRAALAIGAVAMTALTLGMMVAAPALLDSGAMERTVLAAPASVSPAPAEVTIIPSRIDVGGVREPAVATAAQSNVAPRRAREGG